MNNKQATEHAIENPDSGLSSEMWPPIIGPRDIPIPDTAAIFP